MYQEQRAKQKNIEHLHNLVRKGLMPEATRLAIEQTEECLKVALNQQDCFPVNFPAHDGTSGMQQS